MNKCANCGAGAEPKLILCDECYALPVHDGSLEGWQIWRAIHTLVNAKLSPEDIIQLADSPMVQGLMRELIAAMEFRTLFLKKEVDKLK